MKWHHGYHWGLRWRNHVQNDLWGYLCLLLLLLLHLMQNCLVHYSSHLLLVDAVLLHIPSKLLCMRLHHIHYLVVYVHISHLGVRSGLVVIVCFEMPLIDVVGHVPCFGSQICNVVSLLQGCVPQAS